MPTYYEAHKKQLTRVIEGVREKHAASQQTLNFFQKDLALFDQIESAVCKHRLRYYQMEALYVLDYLLGLADSNKAKKGLLETVTKDSPRIPFMGFEMATGSGKTMLMGAACYYLFRKFGINNFLIIAPSSIDIYQKTIRNFQKGTFETIWSESTDFDFNLITGDDYQTPSMFFDPGKEVNVFIFNIDKFGANATNSTKRWEASVWKDAAGNTISIQDFLKEKHLAIITDEAHHAQSPKARKIISGFLPELVLEFTATAVEQNKNQEKANQSIIYKYDIRRFLEDGHGKLVRAVALDNEEKKKKTKAGFSESEKLKLVTLLLIHLIKKRAMLKDQSCKGLKPIAFIKVKNDTEFTRKVYDYVRDELHGDLDNIQIILEKAAQQDLEITNLIRELYKKDFRSNLDKLRQEIQASCANSLFYHGKSTQEEKKLFDNIRKNHIELVVYMQKLDEGIDLPNIYSMAVINDTDTEFRTSVKQIIGRGVRLNKNVREYDDSKDILLTQAEKLHIVSDRGANFEDVILSIQKEFGLTEKYLSSEQPKKQIWNKARSELLDGKYLPKIRADFKTREGVKLAELVENTEQVVQDYLEQNCFTGENDVVYRFLKYVPKSFFIEIDIFSDHKEFHKEIKKAGGSQTSLCIQPRDIDDIYSKVQKTLLCLPDNKNTRKRFHTYADKLNEIDLQYYCSDSADEKLARNKFKDTFSYFYRNYIERNYYDLRFSETAAENSWPLKECFQDYQIILPEDQIEHNKLHELSTKEQFVELVKQNYYFKGFNNSLFEYVKFDSYPEKVMADFIDRITSDVGRGMLPFWVRNERNIFFEYGSHKYFPDFLMLYKDRIFVIETKGDVFSHTMKNALLRKLDDLKGDDIIKGYKGVLIFESLAEEIDAETTWETFLAEAEEALEKKLASNKLQSSVAEDDKFRKYLPVYTVTAAKRKFLEKKEKVKIAGWLPVEEAVYPESAFAVQVKSPALTPKYKLNEWIILNTKFKQQDAVGKVVLYYHPELRAEYDNGYTLRQFTIEELDTGDLFKELKVILSPLNKAFPQKEFSGIVAGAQINIIGVEWEPDREPWVITYPTADDYYNTCLPVSTLKTAAGYWSREQYGLEDSPDWAEKWVKPEGLEGPWEKGTFIAQVIGDSMEPQIPNGSWCVFSPPKAGSREGRIVLVWHAGLIDEETGSAFTLKKYHSEKIPDKDTGWTHQKIVLKPLNPGYKPIVLTPDHENQVRIIAELIEVL